MTLMARGLLTHPATTKLDVVRTPGFLLTSLKTSLFDSIAKEVWSAWCVVVVEREEMEACVYIYNRW